MCSSFQALFLLGALSLCRRLCCSIDHLRSRLCRLRLSHPFIFFLFWLSCLKTLHVHLFEERHRRFTLSHQLTHSRLARLFALFFFVRGGVAGPSIHILLIVFFKDLFAILVRLNGCKRVQLLMKRAKRNRVLPRNINCTRPSVLPTPAAFLLL